jgi:membrane associated rhomboid family serine protease
LQSITDIIKEYKYIFIYFSIVIISLGLIDFAIAIYHRYSDGGSNESVGYAAHLGGAAAGLLIGMNVLRNFVHKVNVKLCLLDAKQSLAQIF